jgi:hypothetical protein
MSDDCASLKSASLRFPLSFWFKYFRSACFFKIIFIAAIAFSGVACSKAERRSIPPEIESAIGTISDDIAAERYEKIYNEASDLWKQASTLEQSTSAFKTLATKLGKMENRTLHSATEQHNSSGPLTGHVFIVSYQTKFEKGAAMETFTLIEKDHQWQLARYFVNSTALN